MKITHGVVLEDITADNCEISVKIENRIFPIVNCKAKIVVEDREEYMETMSGVRYPVVEREYSLIVCDGIRYTQPIDVEFFRDIERYDVKMQFIRKDGKDGVIKLEGIVPERIEIRGEWRFRLSSREGEKIFSAWAMA